MWSFIDLQSTQPGFYPGIFRFVILYCIIILIVVDFNIHICCHGKPLSEGFLDLMGSFNFIQHVSLRMRKGILWT